MLFWEKHFLHTSQRNGFTPECFLMCFIKSDLNTLANFLQRWHSYRRFKHFLSCLIFSFSFLNPRTQPTQRNLYFLTLIFFKQCLHWYDRLPRWVRLCWIRSSFRRPTYSHSWHFNLFIAVGFPRCDNLRHQVNRILVNFFYQN